MAGRGRPQSDARWIRVLFAVALGSAGAILPALAALPEVSNLRLSASGTLSWDALQGSAGYNVYEGDLAGLRSGDYGGCLIGSVQGLSAASPNGPIPVGSGVVFLVDGYDQTGEGQVSGTPGANPSPRCVPARRYFAPASDGDPGDGVPDGVAPIRNPSATTWIHPGTFNADHPGAAGVYLNTGEFFLTETDLPIAGRGDLSRAMLGRHYRSQIAFDGPLGRGWDLDADARLAPVGTDVLYFDGTGRSDRFARIDASHFTSPPGIYSVLAQNVDGSFTLRSPHGLLLDFHAFDGSNRNGALETAVDRDGDMMSFLYDNQGLLTEVVDALGRNNHYAYDVSGRITSITDFAGRQVVYAYDASGNLVSVRSPIVVGTPNGNDFPDGRTTQYQYSSGYADDRLNGNLIGLLRPTESGSGVPAAQIDYGSDPAAFDFDRVVSETYGGTSGGGVSAGGTLTFSYQPLNSGGDPLDLSLPRRQATVFDRDGNERQYVHNFNGNRLTETDFTNRGLRPGEPDYTTQFSYDSDGELILVLRPQGDETQLTYEKPGADRYREGNLIQVRQIADPIAGGGRGDGHGAESADVVRTFTYDPVFNQISSYTGPRGNDPAYVPQNGGPNVIGRYTRTWTYDYQEADPALNGINAYAGQYGISLDAGFPFGLGDVNGDGTTMQAAGNPVLLTEPAVTLDPTSMQATINGGTAQAIQTRIVWNAHGQPIAVTDAEQNRDELQYYPETDPDGDGTLIPPPDDGRVLDPVAGGYLKTEIIDTASAPGRDNASDPGPVQIQYDFKYDPQGTLASITDGRGVLTRSVHNALDELVEVRRADATADAAGPDGTPPTGRGEAGLTAFGYLERFAYDADGNLVTVQSEDRGNTRGAGSFVTTNRTYDILGDLVQEDRLLAGGTTLATHYLYDADQNLVRVTEPDGNSRARAYDERGLLLSSTRGADGPLGGVPSTRTYSYDGDGDLTHVTDGRGSLYDYLYDGHDRVARTVDPVGGTLDLFYDPASELVRRLARGTAGGPTPADRSGDANVDLSDLRLFYDEMGRRYRQDRMLFVPAGVTPARPAMLSDGSLLPGDGAVNTLFEFDRLSRLTFLHRDSGATTRFDYDGAGRMLTRTDPAGDPTDLTYDAGGHPIERAAMESPTLPGPPSELFLTTFFYDSLGRRTMAVDNLGETTRWFYDSLDALTIATDANGPAGGSINRRSPGRTGLSVAINANGNVTRYAYDAAGRLLSTTQVLTASGMGDGSVFPPPDPSNSFNPDGLITRTTSWSGNGLPLVSTDDQGNQTTYAYDNLDRRLYVARSDGFQRQVGYDAEDDIVSATDPNGTSVANAFDAAGRLTTTQATATPGGGVAGTTLRTYEYDGLSRLTRSFDNNNPADSSDDATVAFLHDSLGRTIEEAQIPPPGAGAPRDTDIGWQAADLMTSLTYPDGDQVMYGYDGADRLRNVNDQMHPELMATFEYFGMGRLETRLSGNGVKTTYLDDAGTTDVGYDGVGRPILLRHLDPTNTLLAGFAYRYDRDSNVVASRRLHDLDASQNARGRVDAYDSASRLVSSQEAYLDSGFNIVSPLTDSESWTLDGSGNWAQLTRNGTLYLNTPNNLNEYDEPQCCGTHTEDGLPDDFMDVASTQTADGLNLTYDQNGNQTDTSLDAIDFNFRDVPAAAYSLSTGAAVSAYAYDASGRRTRRAVGGAGGAGATGTWTYAYAGGLLPGAVEDDDAAGAYVRQFGYGPGGRHLWQARSDGSSQYLLEDAFGSTAALVPGMSAAGPPNVLERVVYDPYGKPTFENAANQPLTDAVERFLAESQYQNPFLYAGMRYDPELGARAANVDTDWGGLYASSGYYNPNEGRPMQGRKYTGPTGMPASVMVNPGPPQMPMSRAAFPPPEPSRAPWLDSAPAQDAILPKRLLLKVPPAVLIGGPGGRPIRGADGALYLIPHDGSAAYLMSEWAVPSFDSPAALAEYTGWEGVGTLTLVSFDPSGIASWTAVGMADGGRDLDSVVGSSGAARGVAGVDGFTRAGYKVDVSWDAIVTIELSPGGILSEAAWERGAMKEFIFDREASSVPAANWDAIVTIELSPAGIPSEASWERGAMKEFIFDREASSVPASRWDVMATVTISPDGLHAPADWNDVAAVVDYFSKWDAAAGQGSLPNWETAGYKIHMSWESVGATIESPGMSGALLDADWAEAGPGFASWESFGTLPRRRGD